MAAAKGLQPSTSWSETKRSANIFVSGKLLVLKEMVGAKGFEPSTSWSRTRRASQAALRPDNTNSGTPYEPKRGH
jgi:hypothetical protein